MPNIISTVEDFSDPSSASLSVLEFGRLPWTPQRIYWLSDFVSETARGHHAHKNLSQVFAVIKGSLTLTICVGENCESFTLTPDSGQVQLEPGCWRIISNASRDAVLMVLADAPYDESDYIRDWDEYLKWFSSFEKEI